MSRPWSRRILFAVLLLLFLVLIPAAASEDADELDGWEDLDDLEAELTAASDVTIMGKAQRVLVDLNDHNIERVISSHEYVLLMGYATWCTRSSAVMPEFAAASTLLAGLGSSVLLAKVDAIANPGAATRYGIKGFPTFLFFTNGTAQLYTGGHLRNEFKNWVRKRTGFPVTTISTQGEAEDVLKRNATVVVGYFHGSEGGEYDEFLSVAKEEDGTEFLQVFDPNVVTHFKSIGTDAPPAIGVEKNEPEFFVSFDGNFTKEDMFKFVEVNKHPLVTKLTEDNMNKIYSSAIKHQVLLFTTVEGYQRLASVFLDTAAIFKGKIVFIFVDVADEDLSRPMLAVYGLGPEELVVAAFHNELGSKYVLGKEASSENMKEFGASFLAGNLPLFYKSEPVPAENDGDVKTVVGQTYSQFLSGDTKDLFLQVYSPWCITCEKVNKAFQKVASHLKDVPSIVFAKINAADNEHPLLNVTKFPSLLLYPAGPRTGDPLSPLRETSKELLKFLRENAAIPFTVADLPTSVKGAKRRRGETKVDEKVPEAEVAEEPVEAAVSGSVEILEERVIPLSEPAVSQAGEIADDRIVSLSDEVGQEMESRTHVEKTSEQFLERGEESVKDEL